MLGILKYAISLLILAFILSAASAQNAPRLEAGDPPVAGLLSVSAPDKNGVVTVAGAVGSVFPGAQVAVRNLYTDETVYGQAGLNGSFSTSLYGPGNTPFWVSPSQNIPNNLREQSGSLPGGPGTIVYGTFPQTNPATAIITRLVIDGDVSDWQPYLNAALVTTAPTMYALINEDSIYVALLAENIPTDYTQLNIVFTLDKAVYNLALDPRQQQLATFSRLEPNPNTIGTVVTSASQGQAIEVSIPRNAVETVNPTLESATLEALRFVGADGSDKLIIPVEEAIPLIQEEDGIVRLKSLLGDDFSRFTLSGTAAQGSQRWLAQGRINQMAFQPGDTLVMEMDFALDAPDLPEGLVGLRMFGQIRLQPVADAQGQQTAGGRGSNNGWSDLLTPSGLAISNLRGDFLLGEASIPANQIVRREGQLRFPLDFVLTLPEDLPAGMYVPLFEGYGQVGDGDVFTWDAKSPLGSGKAEPNLFAARLPLVLKIGNVEEVRLLWTLFQDVTSAGSRGVLAEEDRARYALSNRVHFDNPTFILPPNKGGEPIAYSLEPYLLNQMPNDARQTAAPLLPFLFPGGRMTVSVTHPDGKVEDLGSPPIIQNQLSTPALEDSDLFGSESQVDIYSLTTGNALLTDYVFSDYGSYQISLTGNLEDVWGNRYQGGGTYTVLVAEPLSILPGVLPGTPFEVGNALNPGLHLSPGLPADVTIRARIFPLDGSAAIEQVIQGQANSAGYFQANGTGLTFETPGEYVIDYEVRYTDADQRLWAGSLRSAGVIAGHGGSLIAHGQRGLDSAAAEARPAWFDLNQTAPDAAAWLNYPYYTGDVAWVDDTADGRLVPAIQLQDTVGTYADWLWKTFPAYKSANGIGLQALIARQELPVAAFRPPEATYSLPLKPETIVSQGYTYISAVEPGLSARQFVQGGLDGGLPLYWDMDDPYNGQTGAGIDGARPGDYFFLFGGAVLHNAEANIQDSAIYASLAVVIDGKSDALGARVFPPYRGDAGGPNGGPLLTIKDREISMFFHPTGTRPGDVLRLGDTLAIAGQVAPTLPSIVSVKITAPSGAIRRFEGSASSIGYFYDPSQDFAVNEIGVWSVEIHTRHEGNTSAGLVEAPFPTGDILGTADGRFNVYVLPEESEALTWNDTRSDLAIPAAVPYNFNFPLPSDLSDIQVFHTVSTPGYVFDQGPLRPNGRSLSYQYNPTNLVRDFPNLENTGSGDGPASSDVVTLTFVVTGIDAGGHLHISSRVFTIAHDRMMTFG